MTWETLTNNIGVEKDLILFFLLMLFIGVVVWFSLKDKGVKDGYK